MNAISKTAFAATLLALSAGAAPAAAQSAPNARITDGLASLGKAYGDANGHLWITDPTAGSEILAHGQSTYAVYTTEDSISSADSLVFCVEDAAGGLSSCQPAGGATGYTCNYGFCECYDVWDCVSLILSDRCPLLPLNCSVTPCHCAG